MTLTFNDPLIVPSLFSRVIAYTPASARTHLEISKQAADRSQCRATLPSALRSVPSFFQDTVGNGTALYGTGSCNLSPSIATMSSVIKSRVGAPSITRTFFL